jgi:hypothetical protein
MRLNPALFCAAALAVTAGVAGCGVGPLVTGSGDLVQTNVDIGSFSELSVGSAFEVTVRPGDVPSLVLRTDDNLVDRIEAVVDEDELSITLDAAVRDATLEADLTVPASMLSSVDLSGASTLTATEPLTASTVTVQASGASRAFVVVQTDDVTLTASGASVVNATGSTGTLVAEASGSSTLRLEQLDAGSAQVSADGASRVEVSVSGDLRAEAAGASTVRYLGDPDTVERDVSGASSVEPG